MSLHSKPCVSLWPLKENSPVHEILWSITSTDTSKGWIWPLKTGLILAAAQHMHLGFTDPFLLACKRRDCGAAFPKCELEPNFWAAGLSCVSHVVLWHNRMLLQLGHFGNPVNHAAPHGVTSAQLTGWNLLCLAQHWRRKCILSVCPVAWQVFSIHNCRNKLFIKGSCYFGPWTKKVFCK